MNKRGSLKKSLLFALGIVPFAAIGGWFTGSYSCAALSEEMKEMVKGTDNKKLGKDKIIDSKWETMAHFRLPASIICAMFAVPMYTVGF